jgi:ABC-type branched-subunit amino acid transport system substrate-binding protein
MGGDFQAELTGEYWCKKLAGKKARYAGSADLRLKVRKAAVFYPQTDVNTGPARHLEKVLQACGTEVVDVPYSPDTATASSQATSQVAQARNAGATSVLYFSDPIAPAFGTKAMTSQQWFPEHVLVGSGLVDYDVLARLYDPQQWANAFGPSDTVVYKPLGQQEASITWRAAGNSGNAYSSAELQWGYWAVIAAGMQMAGPVLNPGTFEQALLSGSIDSLPWGRTRNPNVNYIHFTRGDYTAASDAKEAYWDANAISPIDGKRGAYVALNGGRRYRIGDWTPGEPVLPGRG